MSQVQNVAFIDELDTLYDRLQALEALLSGMEQMHTRPVVSGACAFVEDMAAKVAGLRSRVEAELKRS